VRVVAAVQFAVPTVKSAALATPGVLERVCAIEHALRKVAVLLARIIPVASPPVPVVDVAVLRARAEPVGRAATFADTAKVSPLTVVADKVTGIETVMVSPTAAAVVDNVPIDIVPVAALAAGIAMTDKSPPINAATATSAMRLKVVFVDICFLSISRSREFPSFGFELIS